MLGLIKALVRVSTVLPDALRPGVSISVAIAVVWMLARRPGLPSLWHASIRQAARIVDASIGLLLLPEFVATTARRRRDAMPSGIAFAVGGVFAPLLASTRAMYERHVTATGLRFKSSMWIVLAVWTVASAAGWVVMNSVSPTSVARHDLGNVFQYWRDAEAWANVSPQDRAAPGGWYPPPPEAIRSGGLPGKVVAEATCRSSQPCAGTVSVSLGIHVVATRRVTLSPHTSEVIVIPVPGLPAHHRPLRVEAKHL